MDAERAVVRESENEMPERAAEETRELTSYAGPDWWTRTGAGKAVAALRSDGNAGKRGQGDELMSVIVGGVFLCRWWMSAHRRGRR